MATPYPTSPARSGRRIAAAVTLVIGVAWSAQLIATPMASADVVSVTIVRSTPLKTVGTTTFDPPAPDSSGIAFDPATGSLVISDSEVEEMPTLFAGKNVWRTTLAGAFVGTSSTTVYTNEPSGLAFDSRPASPSIPTAGHLFVSDDGLNRIFEVAPGPDSTIGTTDDLRVDTIDVGSYGIGDSEDVAFDTDDGALYVSDGIGAEVWRISPGANGVFDGVSPAGDDTTSHFDVAAFGAEDAEGIGYHDDRNTLLIADRNTHTIYEVHKAGLLVNTITLPLSIDHPADVAVAPASAGGGPNLYVVTRGVDNDQDPTENDGMLYELSATLPPLPGNLAPEVEAGSDQGVTMPESATLSGYAADENPGTLTTAWTQVSGPGTATFQDAAALSTTVSFSAAGTYVLRLTATDAGNLSDSDELSVLAVDAGNTVINRPVAFGYDDAEEAQNGSVALGGSDLELVNDGNTRGDQIVGVRFTAINVPRGADVTNAYIQFQTDRVTTGPSSLLVQAQDSTNPDRFRTTTNNISSRPRLAGGVSWPALPWDVAGRAGEAERTPSLEPLVQSLVDRSGWFTGNAMAFIITGTGKRAAESFNGQAAPILHIEYAGGGTNEPPTVNAGPNRQVSLPDTASLAGSVNDDGMPNPPAQVTTSWSLVDGPQSVVFSNDTSPTTDVSFSEAGTYVLRLTASDGVEVVTDDVTVIVESATGSVSNLVGNPGFEAGLTGWNISGSTTGVALSRVDATVTAPKSGSWSGRLANNGTATTDTCKINDQPNWVTNAAGGTYTGSLWAKANGTGERLSLRLREYNAAGALVDVATATLALTATWQQVTVSNAAAAGGSIDLQAWITTAAPGVCFYVDDVVITRT